MWAPSDYIKFIYGQARNRHGILYICKTHPFPSLLSMIRPKYLYALHCVTLSRGICDFVEETPQLRLHAQAGDAASSSRLIESISEQQRLQNPTLAGWLVLSDLRLGNDNGVELGRALLELAPGLHIVIYTQDPSWTLAAEIFRCEYGRTKRSFAALRMTGRRQPGLHGYTLFANIEPAYLERIAIAVVRRHETFIDAEVLNYLLKKLRGQRLTPRQEECASLVAIGLSNDEIALRMGNRHP